MTLVHLRADGGVRGPQGLLVDAARVECVREMGRSRCAVMFVSGREVEAMVDYEVLVKRLDQARTGPTKGGRHEKDPDGGRGGDRGDGGGG